VRDAHLHGRPRSITAPPEEVALAHEMDLQAQAKYGVRYTRYWHDPDAARVYCLVEAPSVHAAKEAHGLLPDEVIEVPPEEVEHFLGKARPSPLGLEPAPFRAVMFTDLQDSTPLAREVGDARFLALLREHDEIIRGGLAANGGREMKHTGDGVLASFVSASRAVEGVIAIQRALGARNQASDGPALRVRVGVTAGEPVESSGDLFGSAVNLAARICAHAQPEQVLVSEVVRELCLGSKLEFLPLPPVELKGLSEPVRLYEVRWRDPGR